MACRAVVIFIVSSPLGVLRTVRHLWQNQSWGGKWSGLCSLGMQLLWYTWLHSAHALDFVLVKFCRGVSFLHWVHIFSGSGLLSRWMNALGSLWSGNSVTRRMRPVRGCPCARTCWFKCNLLTLRVSVLCALNGAKGRFFPFLWRYHLESGLYALCYPAYFEPCIEVFVL